MSGKNSREVGAYAKTKTRKSLAGPDKNKLQDGKTMTGQEKKHICYNGTRCLTVSKAKLVHLDFILETIRNDRKSRILGENKVQI